MIKLVFKIFGKVTKVFPIKTALLQYYFRRKLKFENGEKE